MKKRVLFVNVMIFCSWVTVSRAQLMPARNFVVAPQIGADSTFGFFTHAVFFGEAQRGIGPTRGDMAWVATIGGAIELYRWDSSFALHTKFAQSTFANDLNDIGFNPRAAWWQEEVGMTYTTHHHKELDAFGDDTTPRTVRNEYELGLTYRCKHDIDNSDPYNSDIPSAAGAAQKRVLILGGAYLSIGIDRWFVSRLRCRVNFRLEGFLLAEDNRFPADSLAWSWSNARVSYSYSARVDWQLSPSWIPYVRFGSGGIDRSFFGHRAVDLSAELGNHFSGASGGIDVFGGFAIIDPLSIPGPEGRPGRVFMLGLRMSGAGVW